MPDCDKHAEMEIGCAPTIDSTVSQNRLCELRIQYRVKQHHKQTPPVELGEMGRCTPQGRRAASGAARCPWPRARAGAAAQWPLPCAPCVPSASAAGPPRPATAVPLHPSHTYPLTTSVAYCLLHHRSKKVGRPELCPENKHRHPADAKHTFVGSYHTRKDGSNTSGNNDFHRLFPSIMRRIWVDRCHMCPCLQSCKCLWV